jgi:periplasmic divalent cation tolerance protein
LESEVCEVVITAPDAEWLAGFVRRLVEHRLAAGAHEITSIRSVYRWQGEEHDYLVPCVVALPIVTGGPKYIEWILAETRP